MVPIRMWIEGFLRGRYGYEGNQALRVLAVPALIGAILVAGWLLIASLKASGLIAPVPRFTSDGGTLVRNGVAAILVCGEKKRGFQGMEAAIDYVPEPRVGGWTVKRQGDCSIFYHHPPHFEQRFNRHQRAH